MNQLEPVCIVYQWLRASERCGWCGGRSGNGHWVQPQVQGWSFICWRRALFLRLHLLCQLVVKLLQWLTAL